MESILEELNNDSTPEKFSKVQQALDGKELNSPLNEDIKQFFSRKMVDVSGLKKSLDYLADKVGCDFRSPEKCNVDECQFLLFNHAVLEFHSGSYASSHSVVMLLLQHELNQQLKRNCYALVAENLLRLKRGEECILIVDKYFSSQNLKDQLELSGNSAVSRFELQLRIQKLRACMVEKKTIEAETILKELLDSDVESTQLSHLISNLEYLQKNFDVALSLIGQVSNVASDYKQTGMSYTVTYLNNLGCLFFHLGKTHLAALHFQKALMENQSLLKSLQDSDTVDSLAKFPLPVISSNLYFEILYNLGTALLYCGKSKQAFACFQDCRLKYKDDPQLWLRMAECCVQNIRASNEDDFHLNEKKKNLVKGVLGSGNQRKLILNSRISSLVDNLEAAPEGMDFTNGLKYVNSAVHLANEAVTKGKKAGKNSVFVNRPGNPLSLQEVLRIRISALLVGSFIALTVGEHEVALKYCEDLPEDSCTPAQKYLINLYKAEALVMLSRLDDALPLLNPQNVNSVEPVFPPTEEGPPPQKQANLNAWYPNNVSVARCVMQYNMAAALAVRGDLEKSAEIIRLLWIARGNGADIPTQVVALALYIEIKREELPWK